MATVRIARIRAGQAINSVGAGVSRAGSLTLVRVAGVGGSSASSLTTVRVAGVRAVAGTDTPPTARVSAVVAASPQITYVWNGSQWITGSPVGVILSGGRGVSTVTGVSTRTGATIPSTGKGTSVIVGHVTYSVTAHFTVAPTVIPSAANLGPSDKSFTVTYTTGATLTLSASANIGPPGAGSLTVVPDPANSPPRILLELTGALGTQVTINRVDAAGNKSPVRLANPGTLNGGALIVYDYEAPFNQTVRYVCTTNGPTITSDPVTLLVSQPWLVHPGIPDLSQPLSVVSVGDLTKATNQGAYRPLGRKDAIVITDGQRQSATFDLTVDTGSLDAETALDTLLDDTSPLLLQIVYPNTTRSLYQWVSVGDVVQANLLGGYFPSEISTWTLPCTITSAPSGLLQSQRTWADVIANYATWQDVIDAYATWRDVITDNPIVVV